MPITLFFHQPHRVRNIVVGLVQVEAEFVALSQVVFFVDLEDTHVVGVVPTAQDRARLAVLTQIAFTTGDAQYGVGMQTILATGLDDLLEDGLTSGARRWFNGVRLRDRRRRELGLNQLIQECRVRHRTASGRGDDEACQAYL